MTDSIQQLAQQKCAQCRPGDSAFSTAKLQQFLTKLPDWDLLENHSIQRKWQFSNFAETMSFVNEIANIAEANDHHPDVSFGYNYCIVLLTTHAIKGLSENDFICAAKIELISMDK